MQQDNDPKHAAITTKDFIKGKLGGCSRAKSIIRPSFNEITVHLMKRRLKGRETTPETSVNNFGKASQKKNAAVC